MESGRRSFLLGPHAKAPAQPIKATPAYPWNPNRAAAIAQFAQTLAVAIDELELGARRRAAVLRVCRRPRVVRELRTKVVDPEAPFSPSLSLCSARSCLPPPPFAVASSTLPALALRHRPR